MPEQTPSELSLHTLQPAEGSHRERKRIGRGPGSGTGKTSGRGQNGQKSRSGSHTMRAGFEGGQMPVYMRLGKLRGPNHKKSMPMGPFRTFTAPVNVGALDRFDEGVEVTPELLRAAGLVKGRRHPVKILGDGTLGKRLTVRAHGFSASARQAIEAAGGAAVLIEAAAAEPVEASATDVPDTFVAAPPELDDAASDAETQDASAADAGEAEDDAR